MRSVIISAVLLAAAPAFADDTGVTAAAPQLQVAKQEIGVRLGTQLNVGGVAAGGLRLGGVYLYKLAPSTWFDGVASVAFGSQDRQCYLDRSQALTCAPGVASGFGFEVGGGVRWFFGGAHAEGFHPYVRAGLSLDLDSFAGDGVTGLGIPIWGGAGARIRVADRVAVGFEGLVSFGPVFYGGDAPNGMFVRLIVQGGVELAL